MKFAACSQEMAEDTQFPESCLVISITDSKRELAKIEHPKLLRLEFHDIDRKGNNKYILFDESFAKKILAYVNDNIEGTKSIVAHCHAGVSRSPAVISALSYILNGSDHDLLKAYEFFNRRVYSTIAREFQNNYDEYKAMTDFFNLKLKAKKVNK